MLRRAPRSKAPMGRTPEGAVVRRRVAVDLEPSGHQIRLRCRLDARSCADSVPRIGARLLREPGHVADGNPEAVAFAGLRMRL